MISNYLNTYHNEFSELTIFNSDIYDQVIQINQCLQQFIELHAGADLQAVSLLRGEELLIPRQEGHYLLGKQGVDLMLLIDTFDTREEFGLHQLLLLHGLELGGV